MIAQRGAPVIVARELSRHYGAGNTRVDALRAASFEIGRGEVVAILGPSGSGKSTLLTILGLINQPSAGSLSIDGVDVWREGRAAADLVAWRRRHIGFVFQRSNLIPFLTAEENVRLALELNAAGARAAKRRARVVMGELGVGDRGRHLPAQLSGGQQQRVAIARAVVHEPAIVLADEPTASLDSTRGRQVMQLFQEVARSRNAAVVVVTHDHRTLDLVDRILEMEDGHVAERVHTHG